MGLVCLLLWVIPMTAHGFGTLNADPLLPVGWVDESIPVYLDVTGIEGISLDELETVLEASISTWNEVECSPLWLHYAGVVTESPGAGIYIHWVYPEVLNGILAPDAAGVTETYHGADGVISRADMHLNRAFVWTLLGEIFDPRVVDAEAVLTHELGHALGLAHSREREATLYFAGGDARLRTLHEDDIRGLCFLYARDTGPYGKACDACVADSDCMEEGASCLVFPEGGAFCATPCSDEGGCDLGYECISVAGLDGGRCVPLNGTCGERGGAIGLGEYCYGSATCESGFCLATLHSALCTQVCDVMDPSSCPEPLLCVAGLMPNCPGDFTGQSCGVCVHAGDVSVGDDCWDGGECETGVCISEYDNWGVCSALCDMGGLPCPEGSSCVLGTCVSAGPKPTGSPCGSHFDCHGGFCLPALDGQFRCTESCEANLDCPSNATCGVYEDLRACSLHANCDSGICIAELGVCGCSADGQCDAGLTCNPALASAEVNVCGISLCVPLSKKGQEGEFCADEGGCFGSLLCDVRDEDWGLCGQPCDPLTSGECDDGICRWLPSDALEDAPMGVCGSAGSGSDRGSGCSGSIPCQRHLICARVDDDDPTCYDDCRVSTSAGCDTGFACRALVDPVYPDQGVCVPEELSGQVEKVDFVPDTLPADGPEEKAVNVPGGPGVGGDQEFIPASEYEPPSVSQEGCAAAPDGNSVSWAFLLFLLVLFQHIRCWYRGEGAWLKNK